MGKLRLPAPGEVANLGEGLFSLPAKKAVRTWRLTTSARVRAQRLKMGWS